MYHALKDNGVTGKFIAFPVYGHEPGHPVHESDVYLVWLDWLDQYLKQSRRLKNGLSGSWREDGRLPGD